MLKKLGIPVISLAAMMAIFTPSAADARERSGVGGPVYATPYPTSAPTTPRATMIPTLTQIRMLILYGYYGIGGGVYGGRGYVNRGYAAPSHFGGGHGGRGGRR
jgi:hypothetical protein